MSDPGHPEPEIADAWLRTELPALATITVYTARNGWPEHTARLATALDPYLSLGLTDEVRLIYTHAADAAGACGDYPAQAHCLISLGKHDYEDSSGDDADQQAISRYQQALDIARSCGDSGAQTRALINLGLAHGCLAYQDNDHLQQAAGCYQQALTLARGSGDKYAQARALNNLGFLHSRQHQYAQAAPLYQEALHLSRETGDDDGKHVAADNLHRLADVQVNLGDMDAGQGRYHAAAARYQAVLELPPHWCRLELIRALNGLGCVCAWQGLPDQAASYFRQAADQPSQWSGVTRHLPLVAPQVSAVSAWSGIAEANLDQLTRPGDGRYRLISPPPLHYHLREPEQDALSDGYDFWLSQGFGPSGIGPYIAFTRAGTLLLDDYPD